MSGAPIPRDPRPTATPRDWELVARLGGFHREVGFSIDPTASGNGRCVVRGKVEPRHLNINGVVHGGVYATILDTAMGGAVVTTLGTDEVTATTSLYVEFFRPAVEGNELIAKGEVVRRGRHLAFVQGHLEDQTGRALSQAHGTWYIWSTGDPSAPPPPRIAASSRKRSKKALGPGVLPGPETT